jgi:lincosamide nucleotidyltransferase A/C/D/E
MYNHVKQKMVVNMNPKKHEMTASDAVKIVRLFEQSGFEIVIDGGWGVDALLGQQSRPHEDLDIAVLHRDVPAIRAMLEKQGYSDVPRNDTWECNFVMGDSHGHLIDLHSCTFNEHHENVFGVVYPYESLQGTGSIQGYPVRCIPPEWMVKFHTGYKLMRMITATLFCSASVLAFLA